MFCNILFENKNICILSLRYFLFQPSRSDWQKVFYINGGILAFGALVFVFFASGEEQSWAKASRTANRLQNDEDEGDEPSFSTAHTVQS